MQKGFHGRFVVLQAVEFANRSGQGSSRTTRANFSEHFSSIGGSRTVHGCLNNEVGGGGTDETT